MDKYIPYAKLSKKQKRTLDKQKRGTWGSLNPVTRKPQNPKAYNRKKVRTRQSEDEFVPFLLFA